MSEETSGVNEKKSLKPLALRSFLNLVLLCGLAFVGYQLALLCQLKQTDCEVRLEEVGAARQSNHRLANQNRQLKALVAHLKTDEGVEEIAREKLGLVRSGETAFIVSPVAPERAVYTIVEPPPLSEPEPGFVQLLLHRMFSAHPPQGEARSGAARVDS